MRPGARIDDCAEVYSTSPDPVSENNKSCRQTRVVAPRPVLRTDVAIAKSASATVLPGGAVTYLLTVTNRAGVPARNVVVSDVVSSQVSGTASASRGCTVAGGR